MKQTITPTARRATFADVIYATDKWNIYFKITETTTFWKKYSTELR